MEGTLSADTIKAILAERHSGQGWAYFHEHRPMTGCGATVNSIDGVAVGLWMKTFGIFSYEIKISRGDFLQDVRQFKKKHSCALDISHYFYYVCPWGLIDKSEVPEIAGLMYINKSNGIQIKKQAVLRELESMPIEYFQGFVREFGNKVDNTKIPIQLMGKNVTKDELLDMIDSEAEKKKGWQFEKSVNEAVDKRTEKTENERRLMENLKRTCGIHSYFSKNDEEDFKIIEKLCLLGRSLSERGQLKKNLEGFKIGVERLESALEEIEAMKC